MRHMGRSQSECITEFMVGKEFTDRKEFTVQEKKSEQSSPLVVRALHGAELKCMHHRVHGW